MFVLFFGLMAGFAYELPFSYFALGFFAIILEVIIGAVTKDL